MNASETFFIGIVVQVIVGVLQFAAAVLFIYRWQKNSWRFSNLMNIREPLARAYCSLSSVLTNQQRLSAETDEILKSHDRERIQKIIVQSQDEILNFSIEHFKAKFWMRGAENAQLDVLFNRLRDVWTTLRTGNGDGEAALTGLRKEIRVRYTNRILMLTVPAGAMTTGGGKAFPIPPSPTSPHSWAQARSLD
jgi:hypothetical protein